jgi:sec-independent protein translocase protein TatA
MFPSWLQILLVVMLALIFFGRGKISDFMTDLASGIKSFRKGMSDDDDDDNNNTAIEDNEDKE